jgi:hypothetical protein
MNIYKNPVLGQHEKCSGSNPLVMGLIPSFARRGGGGFDYFS